jgi:cell volume regulation protein A
MTISPELILGLVGGLLVLAFLANRIFRLTGIPDVVLLMALGVVLGPVLGLVNPGSLTRTTHLLGTLAIILVLFEGALELDLRETLRHFRGSLLLAFLAYAFSVVLVAFLVSRALGLPLISGLLTGAALGCTSSTVVLPVLQQLKVGDATRVTLTLESSWGDVLAVLTVSLLLGLRGGGGTIALGLAHGVLLQVGVAVLFSVAAGVLWSRLLRVLSEQRFWQVLTFSIVLVLYAGMEGVGANGLIAVLGFGLTLSNFPGIDPGLGLWHRVTAVAESQQALLTFHSELAFLVRTFFFVLIGAVAELETFRDHPLLMAGTVAALFLARWLAMQASRWAWRDIGAQGRQMILWMLPRGLITVVLAIEVTEARGNQFSFLPGLAFAVILATNLMVVLGSLLVRLNAPPAEAVPADSPAAPAPSLASAPVEKQPPSQDHTPRRRWAMDASLLVLLGAAGVILWYANRPAGAGTPTVVEWIRLHFHR